jgi:hypothetical protein
VHKLLSISLRWMTQVLIQSGYEDLLSNAEGLKFQREIYFLNLSFLALSLANCDMTSLDANIQY